MSYYKEKLFAEESKKQNKLNGYRTHLINIGEDYMNCPGCGEILSYFYSSKEQCIHCGYILKWNDD